MILKTIEFIKKIIVTVFILYGINVIISNMGVILPINIISVGLVSLLGLSGLISLIILYIFI